MAGTREIRTTLALDGEQKFKAAMDEAYRGLKVLGSEMKLNTQLFGENATSMEGLTNKSKLLKSEIAQQKEIVSALSKAVTDAATAYGENDKRTDAYRIKLNNAMSTLSKMESELNANETAIQNFGKEADSSGDKTKRFGKSADEAAHSLHAGFSAATVAAGQLLADFARRALAGVASMAKTALAYNQQMEDYTTNFGVLLKDEAKGIAKVEELKKLAAKTPFAMADLAGATETLLAFNVSGEKSSTTLTQLGDISLGNAEKLKALSAAYGKANATGKLTGEVVQQMITAGFNPLQTISEMTGESMEKLQKKLAKGKISVEDLDKAMAYATGSNGKYYQGMEKASKTLSGLFSTLKDNATALLGKISAPFVEVLKDTVMPKLLTLVDSLSAFIEANQEAFDGLAQVVGDLVVGALEGLINFIQWAIDNGDKLVAILAAIGVTIVAIMFAINPIPMAIAAIGAAVVALIANWDAVMAFMAGIGQWIYDNVIAPVVGFFTGMWSGVSTAASDAWAWIVGVWQAVSAWFNDNVTVPVVSFFAEMWLSVKDLFSTLWDWVVQIWAGVSTWFNDNVIIPVVDFFTGLWSGISTAASDAWDAIVLIWEAVSTWFSENVIAPVAEFFAPLWTGISDAASTAWDSIVLVWTAVSTWFNTNVILPVTTLFSTFWDGISVAAKNTWDSIVGWIAQAIKDIKEFLGLQDEAANKSSVNEGGHGPGNRSFASGLDYVPYNNFSARLHEGEAVLTKSEAKVWRAGSSPVISDVAIDRMADRIAVAIMSQPAGEVTIDGRALGRFVRAVTT